MSPSLQQAHYHPPEGSPFQHHNSTSISPNIRLRWQRNRRILWPATECHWSDTEGGHSCCARRLECKSGQGCLWKLARQLWTLLQWRHKWEKTRLLAFATFNDLVLANTVCRHKTSRRWTCHSPNGQHRNQIDYILVRKRFRSGVNSARTRSIPGTDIGSDHDLLMITHKTSKNTQDSSLTSKSWKIPTCWKPSKLWWAGSLHLSASWATKIQTKIQWSPPSTQQWLKQPVRSSANIVRRKEPWVTAEILDLCDERWEVKEKRFEPEGSEKYKESEQHHQEVHEKVKRKLDRRTV